MADVAFNRPKKMFPAGELDWDATPGIRCLILSTALSTPSADLVFLADLLDGVNWIEMSVAAGTTNYDRQDLLGRVVIQDDVNDRAILDADNVVFPSLGPASGGQTGRVIVTYLRVGVDDSTPEDDLLIYYHDIVDTQVNGANYPVEWSASGLSSHG